MKKTVFTLAVMAISAVSFAQDLVVKEVKKVMSKGENIGYESVVPSTQTKQAVDVMADFMKPYKGKMIKPEKGGMEYLFDDCVIPDLSENTVDVHVLLIQEGTSLRLTQFFNLGGAFVSSTLNESKSKVANGITTKLIGKLAATQIQAQIDLENKKLETLNGDLKKIVSAKVDADKDIEKAKKEISTSEVNIRTGETNKELNTKSVADQQVKVAKQQEELAKFDRKALETEIKALESDKSKLEKDNEKLAKEIGEKQALIEKYKTEIATATTQVETNKQSLDGKIKVIQEKQATVQNNNLEEKEKALKSAQDEVKKTQGEGEKIVKDIDKNKSNIASNKTEITTKETVIVTNLTTQEAKKKEIDAQTEVVNKLKQLLSTTQSK